MAQAFHSSTPPPDAFTDSVMRRIDPRVLASMSEIQVSAIVDAISASRPLKNHPVDIRGTLPLFLARYYFVFLMGRDRRAAVQKVEDVRRKRTALAGGGVFLLFALSPVFLVGLVVLYLVKSDLGIDLVHGQHAWEVLRSWIQ